MFGFYLAEIRGRGQAGRLVIGFAAVSDVEDAHGVGLSAVLVDDAVVAYS